MGVGEAVLQLHMLCSPELVSMWCWHLCSVFFFHPKQWPVPKNPGDKKPVKSETSPVAPRAGPQQKVQPQQPLPQPQPPHKASQGLQVPAVSLYPSRKKVPVKDLPPFGKFLKSCFSGGICWHNVHLGWFCLMHFISLWPSSNNKQQLSFMTVLINKFIFS